MQVAVVYPHQLFDPHPAVVPGRLVLLVEDPLFFGTDPKWPMAMHKQKLVLHFASMAAYAGALAARGQPVAIAKLPAEPGIDGIGVLRANLPAGTEEIHVAEVVDDVLDKRLRRFCAGCGIGLVVHPSPNFLTPAAFLETHIGSRKKPFMARFYEAQRKRMRVLIEPDGSPTGGRWSFDDENRRKWPKGRIPPTEPRAEPNDFVRDAIQRVEREFPDRPGCAAGFRWPVTRADAVSWMRQFFEERLAGFGPYEDAISTGHRFLHHSALTPMLNIGLLDPQEIVAGALGAAEGGRVPVASTEGFIRQVTGWREFVRGIYQFRSVPVRTRNFWGFTRPIPSSFYDATTGIAPVDRVIRGILETGYCHHIERLMVLGSFLLLCRIRPDDVYRWFMEMFVDAYDWVMVPNVYGMSQFADGGTFTTKPYLSGSNYLLKMGDEPKGPWCPVWDGLFWTFIADHRDFFLTNPRLSMMVRTWDKMDEPKRGEHLSAARRFLAGLDG